MLVAVILLQSSQTGGMGAAISGTAFNAAFGGQGADKLLVRITTFLAVLFLSLAITLNYLNVPGSNVDDSNSGMTKKKSDEGNNTLINQEENSNTQEDESNDENSTNQPEENLSQ